MSRIHPAPFGARVKRFLPLGYHPALNTFPGTYKYTNLSPGCYNVNNYRKIICSVPSWTRCLKDEDFSRRLAYKNSNILKERLWRKSVNGPGWQDVYETKIIVGGGTFRRNCKFRSLKRKQYAVPGPGMSVHLNCAKNKNRISINRLFDEQRRI